MTAGRRGVSLTASQKGWKMTAGVGRGEVCDQQCEHVSAFFYYAFKKNYPWRVTRNSDDAEQIFEKTPR